MSKAKKIREAYNIELLKQTDPYEYYIKLTDYEQGGEHEYVPQKFDVPCGRVYEYEDYFVFEEENGYSSDAERDYLVTFARKLNADFAYSDIDFVDAEGKRYQPFFKPEFDWDTYEAFDYISDFYAVKKELNNAALTNWNKIAHVTKVLYHSTYGKDEKIQPAIEFVNQKYDKRFIAPDYYSDDSITDDTVSVIIPSKDNPDRLDACFKSIKNAKIKSKFNQINIYVVDNGSTIDNKEKITDVILKYHDDEDIEIHYTYEPEEFNFSKMCNTGAEQSDADYFLFLNDDVEITDDDFIIKLLYYARRPHVGAVGCKLLYPGGNKIQHVGITSLKHAGPTHKLSTLPDDKTLYFGRNRGVHNCLAVTGACLMVSSDKFFKTGGFCDKMKVGYNDVDFCVSLYENGYHNIVNNDLCLIHHESVTRGTDAGNIERLKRLKEERDLLYKRHPYLIKSCDPYYNPNLAGDFIDYRVNAVPDFENRSYRSAKMNFPEGRKKISRDLCYNIELIETKIDESSLKYYVEIRGWALLNKNDNAFWEPYVYIYNPNSVEGAETDDKQEIEPVNGITLTTAPVYRQDLQPVFPKAKNVDLSGFIMRIDYKNISFLGNMKDLRVSVILQNKKTGKLLYGKSE